MKKYLKKLLSYKLPQANACGIRSHASGRTSTSLFSTASSLRLCSGYSRFENKKLKPLFFIVILGFLVRLVFLWQHDFWFDEAFSYFIAKLPISTLLIATAADNNPPFYYLVLKFFLTFGSNYLYLRFLSLVFGVLSIPLVYKIAKELKKEESVSILSALIFSLSPLTVYFSTETRMYQLLVFEALLFIFLFLKLLRKKDRVLQILFVLVGVLGVYTHYYFILLIFLLFLFGIFKKLQRTNFLFRSLRKPPVSNLAEEANKKQSRGKPKPPASVLGDALFWFLTFAAIGLSFLPWFVFYLSYQHPGCWCFSPVIGIPATFASFFINGVGFVTFRDFLQLPTFEFILLMFVAGIFLFFFLVGIVQKRKVGLGEFLLIGSFVLVSVISIFRPFFSPRAFLIFAPFFYIVTSEGVYLFVKKSLRKSFLIVAMFLGLVLTLFITQPILKGQPIKQSVLYLNQEFKEGDIISHTSVYTFYSYRYYSGDQKPQYMTLASELSPHTIFKIGGFSSDIKEISKRGQRLWLIHIPEWTSLEKAQEMKLFLAKNYPLIKYKQFGSIEILLFDIFSSKSK